MRKTFSVPNPLERPAFRGAGSHVDRVQIFEDEGWRMPSNTRTWRAGRTSAGQVLNLLARATKGFT